MFVFHGKKVQASGHWLGLCHLLVTGWGLLQGLSPVRWGNGFQAPAWPCLAPHKRSPAPLEDSPSQLTWARVCGKNMAVRVTMDPPIHWPCGAGS